MIEGLSVAMLTFHQNPFLSVLSIVYVPAETAAVFTVVNPLTASILGFAAAGESMSPAKAVGYVLILLSLILYNT